MRRTATYDYVVWHDNKYYPICDTCRQPILDIDRGMLVSSCKNGQCDNWRFVHKNQECDNDRMGTWHFVSDVVRDRANIFKKMKQQGAFRALDYDEYETLAAAVYLIQKDTPSQKQALQPQVKREVCTADKVMQAENNVAGVYLLKCGNRFKIGRGNNVRSRIQQLQTGAPFAVEHIHTIKSGDAVVVERMLHKLYANKRVHLEWFQLDAADVAYICSL